MFFAEGVDAGLFDAGGDGVCAAEVEDGVVFGDVFLLLEDW